MAESIERFPVSEKGYSLPINEVLTGRGFVTGKSGSGKSNTASVVAEELLERGLGLLIIDTDGEYSALKERYELLHVGADEECDREVSAEDAPLIADLALEENVPIILDVSGYMDEEVADDVIHAVIRELFVAEKQYQKPFLLFVEEAHEFIPERGGGDDVHKMLVRIAKRGRKRGLGVVAMSQRPAAVAKDYITQCDWLVWHRLTWENDTKVAGRILGGDAAESVQSLEDGEALVMTDWDETISRVQFRRKKTVDEGSTPTLHEAYGPPSAREDHLTQQFDEDDADDDGSNADDGDADDSAAEGELEYPADGADDSDTEAGEPTESDGHRSKSRGASGSAVDRSSNWDLSDVDLSPRSSGDDRSSGSRSTRTIGQGNRPDRATTASASDESHVHPDDSATTGRELSRVERAARRRRLEEPDEYDPLWEVGQLIVFTYCWVADAHTSIHRRLKRVYAMALARIRGSIGRRPADVVPGRSARAIGSILSVSTILALYAALIGAILVISMGA